MRVGKSLAEGRGPSLPTTQRVEVSAGAHLCAKQRATPPPSTWEFRERSAGSRAFLLVDQHGHLHLLVDPPPPQLPGVQEFRAKQPASLPFSCHCQAGQTSPSASTTSAVCPLPHAAPPTSFSLTTASAAAPTCTPQQEHSSPPRAPPTSSSTSVRYLLGDAPSSLSPTADYSLAPRFIAPSANVSA